jgi:hypothetical protein
MLQRIQSIFLLLASGGILSLLSNSLQLIAVDGDKGSAGKLLRDGALTMNEDVVLMSVGIAAALVFLVAIFLYKNRPVQLKVVITAVVLTILMIVLAAYDVFSNLSGMGGAISIVPTLGGFIPILTVLFGLFALRFIRKDEKLVRSMNRLR